MHVNDRWLRKKTACKEVAAKNTGWNSYSIHDRETVRKRLYVQHEAKRDVAAKLGHIPPGDLDYAWSIAVNDVRLHRFRGATSKYVPHQGKRERARRIRQEAARGL